ncbi:DNA-directed RNA polymerase specialized sigma subunit, sigma24 family [Mucilaginibacter gossypiicola]|uniref:DNA-directed RNA polymerase specialized sigma subunit, sigma24 family n=1 Tax=Mucilaginibacter gossypiicola TaxID=551995 RepID=A0A1H8M7N8_9SPHI|nr:sigma-70 family RNA polymerase sigma factor [Mucilaginibacter gossypiicola]SEO13280.1 DNA-directed RNA polymerase specialized sigma subunit, sigma24 family [Mucilaginibacter gossypiicola]
MAHEIVFDKPATEREKLITELYKSAFPTLAKYVSKMGGSFDDAKDVFHDALVIYYEKTVNGELLVHAGEKAYLLGIAKHLWFKKFRNGSNNLSLDSCDFDLADEANEQLSTNKLMHYLETAGKKCMELLSAFYYHKLPMKEVAGLFGYAGERSATVQKYKCIEKVRKTVKEQSLTYADFIE